MRAYIQSCSRWRDVGTKPEVVLDMLPIQEVKGNLLTTTSSLNVVEPTDN